jgi:hypothetical protein
LIRCEMGILGKIHQAQNSQLVLRQRNPSRKFAPHNSSNPCNKEYAGSD